MPMAANGVKAVFCNMLRGIMIAILFLPPVVAFSQPPSAIDSLRTSLANEKTDTGRVRTLLRIAKLYETNNQDSAIWYLEKSKAIADRIKYDRGIFTYYDQSAIVSFTRGEYDKAMEENQKALLLARKMKDSSLVIVALNHIGIVYGLQQRYKEQLDYAIQVKNILELNNDSFRLPNAYHSLANGYQNLRQFRKAADYAAYSIRISTLYKKQKNSYINRVYATLAQAYDGLSMPDSALYFYNIAIRESIALGDKYAEANIYGYVSTLYANLGRYNEMRQMADKSLVIAKTLQSREMEASALYTAGFAGFLSGNNALARKYVDTALDLALQDSLLLLMTNSYSVLSSIAAREGDFPGYVRAKNKTDSVYEIILNTEVVKSSAELEKKYESEKKDAQLKLQQVQLQKKNTFNSILIASAVLLLFILLMGYRNFTQKQRLQQQHIRELEKDKILVAVDALMKGQEDERSRLAKDLHDGLGGLLSGVKFSLINMKDSFVISAANMTVFERSLDMIDTSIQELRRVAHNMMPEMLMKFGLDDALKEYCNSLNLTGMVKISYRSLGMQTRLDSTTEIIIYRIVQELLNNIMKHAAATEAFVQLVYDSPRLNILVEDNGKGFDVSNDQQKQGAGLANVRSRVNYLQGQLAIDAVPGKGTIINIEFNLAS